MEVKVKYILIKLYTIKMKNIMEKKLEREIINNAYTFDSYKAIVRKFAEGGKTSGEDQSSERIFFTKLNFERLKRIEKTTEISEELVSEISKISEPIFLLVIAETWCGDVAQNLPPLAKMTEINPNIKLRIIFRDEYPEIMDEFLTEGTKSIPVCLIIKAETLEVIYKWGPRPQTAQRMMKEFKSRSDYNHDEAVKQIQVWYAKDRTMTLQNEFLDIFKVLHTD